MNLEKHGANWYWTLDDGAGAVVAFSPLFKDYETAKTLAIQFAQLINRPVLFKPVDPPAQPPPLPGAAVFNLDDYRPKG